MSFGIQISLKIYFCTMFVGPVLIRHLEIVERNKEHFKTAHRKAKNMSLKSDSNFPLYLCFPLIQYDFCFLLRKCFLVQTPQFLITDRTSQDLETFLSVFSSRITVRLSVSQINSMTKNKLYYYSVRKMSLRKLLQHLHSIGMLHLGCDHEQDIYVNRHILTLCISEISPVFRIQIETSTWLHIMKKKGRFLSLERQALLPM